MKPLKETYYLVQKDMVLEWRQKYALASILLYSASVVFVIYTALTLDHALDKMEKKIWNILFWLTILFTAVNAIAKSFSQEGRERMVYYYTVLDPRTVIMAKMAYNVLLMLLLTAVNLAVFSVMLGSPVQNYLIYAITLVLGASGFSFVLTLISAIAAKAGNNAALMAILSFPLILPLIMLLQKLSRFAFVPIVELADISHHVMALTALDLALVAMSYILFPYLWRD
jgi:heme exporter protein B